MPLDAFLLALGSAVLHALWNLILGRERDTEAATAVALVTSVIVFAPVAIVLWDVDSGVWPYIAVTSSLQLLYFVLLAAAYTRADVSVVYPVARGLAPVIVLVVGIVALGVTLEPVQALGVCLVGGGVLLVRGLGRNARAEGIVFGLAVACCIAAYTLVDKPGVTHANPIVYLELGMVPASLGYIVLLLTVHRSGAARLRAATRPLPAAAGVLSFVAYALVLAALVRAPAAPVAAVRETSVLFAAALAAPLLGERVGWGRMVGAVLVVTGVVAIALG